MGFPRVQCVAEKARKSWLRIGNCLMETLSKVAVETPGVIEPLLTAKPTRRPVP